MTVRFQRLIIIIFSLILIICSVLLIMVNSRQNLIFFYTPSELYELDNIINKKIRIGGLVKKNSIKTISDDKEFINFIITDNDKEIQVKYSGILPDLFKEDQGVVAEGEIITGGTLLAKKVFAKHDENYMPASIKKQLKKNDYWKKQY